MVKTFKAQIALNKIHTTPLPDGEYVISLIKADNLSTIEEYRKLYFALRDIVYETDGQYSKKEYHDLFKRRLIPNLSDMCFRKEMSLSTDCLNEFGWNIFIQDMKSYVKDMFNIFL